MNLTSSLSYQTWLYTYDLIFGGSGGLVDGVRIHSFSILMLKGSIKFESSELSCTFVLFVKELSLSAELLRVQCLYRSGGVA